MKDIERLHHAVTCLVNGWHERVEYKVVIDGQSEARVKRVRHDALLVQLHHAAGYAPASGSGIGNSNKPGSRPPGNMAPLHLIDTITEQARYHYHDLCTVVHGREPTIIRKRPVTQTLHDLVMVAYSCGEDYPYAVRDVTCVALQWVRKSRVLLGYEKPHVLLRDMVCGTCGGALVVASDANSDVRCIGTNAEPSCGQVYPRWQWLDLLGGA